MNADMIFQGFLIVCMTVLAVLTIVAIIRSIIGPNTSDRIIAVNMIGTITIVLIAILTVFLNEDYLGDVCLIYSMMSFIAVVVLVKVYTGIFLEEKGIEGNQNAINTNLENQTGNDGNKKKEDINGNH